MDGRFDNLHHASEAPGVTLSRQGAFFRSRWPPWLEVNTVIYLFLLSMSVFYLSLKSKPKYSASQASHKGQFACCEVSTVSAYSPFLSHNHTHTHTHTKTHSSQITKTSFSPYPALQSRTAFTTSLLNIGDSDRCYHF